MLADAALTAEHRLIHHPFGERCQVPAFDLSDYLVDVPRIRHHLRGRVRMTERVTRTEYRTFLASAAHLRAEFGDPHGLPFQTDNRMILRQNDDPTGRLGMLSPGAAIVPIIAPPTMIANWISPRAASIIDEIGDARPTGASTVTGRPDFTADGEYAGGDGYSIGRRGNVLQCYDIADRNAHRKRQTSGRHYPAGDLPYEYEFVARGIGIGKCRDAQTRITRRWPFMASIGRSVLVLDGVYTALRTGPFHGDDKTPDKHLPPVTA
jgi:hypothetical protein